MPALNELDPYFDSIDAPEVIRARCRILLQRHEALLGRAPEHVLLENEKTQEGAIQFSSLSCLIGSAYVDLPIPEPNWNPAIIPFRKIERVEVLELHDFDLANWVPTSQFAISIAVGDSYGFHLKAIGRNCVHLLELARNQIIPRALT